MSGLRERQKEQRKEAILQAALQLFDTNGYPATTVEQIAAEAGVSAPTVFNYFGSKQEILLGLVERADRSAIVEIRAQIPHFDNAVDAFCSFQASFMKCELEALPISIWRELMKLNSSVSEGSERLNQQLACQIAGLLRELQERGILRKDVDADFAAEVLNNYCTLIFAKLVRQDNPDYAAHNAHLRRVADIFFRGLHS